MLLNKHLRRVFNNSQMRFQMLDVQGIHIHKAYELIAEAMKLFGNSAYGKTVTNKE